MGDGLAGGLSGRLGPLVAAALVVAGTAGVVTGTRARPPSLSPGVNGFVNDDRPGINAHNSPAAAADPARPGHLAVADRIDTPRFSCSVARSANGGLTWVPVALPLPDGAPNCYWPDVAFDAQGRLLVLYTATGGRFNLPVGVWLQRFDGRTPEGPAVPVAGPLAFHARMAVAGRRVLVSWVQAGPDTADKPLGFGPPPNPVVVARSDDGGATFGDPVPVSEPHRLVAQPTVLALPGDRVLVGALDLGDDLLNYEAQHGGQGGPPPPGGWRVVVWPSDDGGVSFGPPAVVADDLVIPGRIIVDLAPAPAFAADADGRRVYAGWDAGRGDRRDVFVSSSADGGATWEPPVPVLPRRSGQFLPALGVAPDGRVDVVFYDRAADPDDALAEVTLATSWDHGRTFVAATVSDRPFDSRIGLGSVQGIPLLGSHVEVLSGLGRAVAFWSDTRRGRVDDNIQDLAVTVVDVHPARGARVALSATGAALVVAGLGAGARLRPGKAAGRTDTPGSQA